MKNSLGPDVVQEVFRLLARKQGPGARKTRTTSPFGLEENRRNLEVAIDYVFRQGLIPKRYTVDELFEP